MCIEFTKGFLAVGNSFALSTQRGSLAMRGPPACPLDIELSPPQDEAMA